MKKQYRNIIETKDKINPYEFDKTLLECRNFLDELLKEHGENAYIEWHRDYYESYDVEPSPRFFIKAERKETDSEYNERIEKEKSIQKEREKQEKAEYKRLQQKFGGKQ